MPKTGANMTCGVLSLPALPDYNERLAQGKGGMRMPREARDSRGYETYHIVVQGKRGTCLFREEEDKRLYLEKLEKGCRAEGTALLAYCILPDHLHLVIEEKEGNVSGLMRRVHVMFASGYRNRHEGSGTEPIIRDRFRSEKIGSDRRLLEIIWHVHHEPVLQGLCQSAEDYPWSSASLYAEAEKGIRAEDSGKEGLPHRPRTETKRLLTILHFGGGYGTFSKTRLKESAAVLEEVPESYGRSDEEATALIEKRLQGASIEELKRWPEDEKRAFVRRMRREENIGILQLCRITGMSRGVVQRL